MTRPPPGVSFAQFFPNAPKVRAEAQAQSHGRAADRERSSRGVSGADSSRAPAAAAAALDADATTTKTAAALARPSHGDAPHPHADDNASPTAEMPSTVGSASSHASSASSIFSSSLRPSATAPSSRLRDSLSNSPAPAPKPDMSAFASAPTDHARQASRQTRPVVDNGSLSHDRPPAERVPARDPLPSVKGMKCTYDPILDRLRNKGVSKNAKPTYKEFGLVRTTIIYPGCRGEGGRHVVSSLY